MGEFFPFFLISFMTAIAGGSLAEVVKIYRDSSFPMDDFLLPSSQCPENRPQCSKFNGSVLSLCWCTCDDIQGEESGFFEPNFGCTQASITRQKAGCQLLFADETENQRLTFFPTDSTRERNVSVPANQTCSFFFGNQFFVQYLDCAGSWRSITSQNVLDTIELNPGWSTSRLSIRIRAGSTLFTNFIAGRLVRVAIQCRLAENFNDQFTSSCVVFQSHGSIECPYPQPTLSPALSMVTLPTPVPEAITFLPATTPTEKPTTSTSSEQATVSNTTKVPKRTTTPPQGLNQTTLPTPATERLTTSKPTTAIPDCLPILTLYLQSQAALLQSLKNDLEKTKKELQQAIGQWPPGHYCILASGSCPAGFTRSQGHMRTLRKYTAGPSYITPATFGSSYIRCHGWCGQYGQWSAELVIAACCK